MTCRAATTPTVHPQWRILVPLLTGVLTTSLAVGMINTALPRLALDLDLSAAARTWVADIYPLCLAIGIVTAARAGDALGRRRVLASGLAVFAAASAIAATASNGATLIGARAALGFAGAMVVAGVVSTIGAVFDGHARTAANGAWIAVFGAASAIGPVLGGVLTETVGWRGVFWLSVPSALIGLILTMVLVPETRSAAPVTWDRFSIVGSAGGLGLAVYAIHHLTDGAVVAAVTGIGATVLLVLFVRRQRRLREPMIDVGMFAHRDFAVASIAMAISSGAAAACIYLVSIDLQAAGRSPLGTGVALLPQAVATTIGGVSAPWIANLVRRASAIRTMLTLQAAGLILVATLPAALPVGLALVGVGFGIVGTLATSTLFDASAPSQVAQVGVVQEVAFALGAGGGIAVFGTVATLTRPDGAAVALVAAATACLTVAGVRADARG
ncbi:MFS transporter [Tsukamurella strandjordii]|uniref:MFS transporter n=1 Tax=Tsukamurella strandjordii TaxID=147577 RepID=A0AA90NBY0_9ACTN|nr:MFS transporter [Tsukamurella strandjordii]MDP0397617.1 MFS transporter [Tsukamurella strandjordii]